MHTHPTGLHSPTKVMDGAKYIFHYHCAAPCTYAPSSFAEAEYIVRPNWTLKIHGFDIPENQIRKRNGTERKQIELM